MTTMRGRLLPLRSRIVVAIVALCGLSSGLIVLDSVGAGLAVDNRGSSRAQAATCLLSPQGCASGTISNGAVTVVKSKTKAGTAAKPGSSIGVIPKIVVPPPSLSATALAFQCRLLASKPWYCPAPAAVVTPPTPAQAAITLRDIASFIPLDPSLTSEPQGWAIAHLPINFVGGSRVHTRDGRLLGDPASVRFTPTRYVWAFGDGSTATTTTPGLSWAALGLSDFSVTPTSHNFVLTGRYTVTLTVTYTAAYSLNGGGWRAIAGTLARSSSVLVDVSAGGVPLLVARSCVNNPRAPGC